MCARFIHNLHSRLHANRSRRWILGPVGPRYDVSDQGTRSRRGGDASAAIPQQTEHEGGKPKRMHFGPSQLLSLPKLHASRAHSAAMSRPVARVSLWLVLE